MHQEEHGTSIHRQLFIEPGQAVFTEMSVRLPLSQGIQDDEPTDLALYDELNEAIGVGLSFRERA
mgnify:CR=1 FL=1